MGQLTRTALVERVNSHTLLWRQGDIIGSGALAWIARPREPLTPESAQAQGSGLTAIVAEYNQLAIISQTCDIVRDCKTRPLLLVAPIVHLQEPQAGESRKGRRPRYVPVPGLGDSAFADTDLVVTIEKSVVLGSEPIRGLRDRESQRRFSLGISRVFSRFAFPDDLARSLRPFVNRVKQKHGRQSLEGMALEIIEEIRATGVPSWDAEPLDVFIIVSPATRTEADQVMSQGQWDSLVDKWLERVEPTGVIASVDGAMTPLDELSARQYIDSEPLDLDHLSWPVGEG